MNPDFPSMVGGGPGELQSNATSTPATRTALTVSAGQVYFEKMRARPPRAGSGGDVRGEGLLRERTKTCCSMGDARRLCHIDWLLRRARAVGTCPFLG